MTGAVPQLLVHGTAVALNGHGVLLRGAPGSGKSDLAVQLLDVPGRGVTGLAMQGRLIADDQTVLALVDGRLIAAAPPTLAGKLELRGFGILSVPHVASAPLSLVVDLMPKAEIERMPPPEALSVELLGLRVARCCVDAQQPSAGARVRSVLQAVLAGQIPP